MLIARYDSGRASEWQEREGRAARNNVKHARGQRASLEALRQSTVKTVDDMKASHRQNLERMHQEHQAQMEATTRDLETEMANLKETLAAAKHAHTVPPPHAGNAPRPNEGAAAAAAAEHGTTKTPIPDGASPAVRRGSETAHKC